MQNPSDLLSAGVGITGNAGSQTVTVVAAPAAGTHYRLWGWSGGFSGIQSSPPGSAQMILHLVVGTPPTDITLTYDTVALLEYGPRFFHHLFPGGIVPTSITSSLRVRTTDDTVGTSYRVFVYYTLEKD